MSNRVPVDISPVDTKENFLEVLARGSWQRLRSDIEHTEEMLKLLFPKPTYADNWDRTFGRKHR